MISGTLVKILGIVLLIVVAVVLILGIGTLFKGGETSKKYSNKLMQLRVLLQFLAIVALSSESCSTTFSTGAGADFTSGLIFGVGLFLASPTGGALGAVGAAGSGVVKDGVTNSSSLSKEE